MSNALETIQVVKGMAPADLLVVVTSLFREINNMDLDESIIRYQAISLVEGGLPFLSKDKKMVADIKVAIKLRMITILKAPRKGSLVFSNSLTLDEKRVAGVLGLDYFRMADLLE